MGKIETKENHFCRKIQFLEIQHPKFENSRPGLIESVHEIMVDVTSLTPPSPGLSPTLLSNKILNPAVPQDQKM